MSTRTETIQKELYLDKNAFIEIRSYKYNADRAFLVNNGKRIPISLTTVLNWQKEGLVEK